MLARAANAESCVILSTAIAVQSFTHRRAYPLMMHTTLRLYWKRLQWQVASKKLLECTATGCIETTTQSRVRNFREARKAEKVALVARAFSRISRDATKSGLAVGRGGEDLVSCIEESWCLSCCSGIPSVLNSQIC